MALSKTDKRNALDSLRQYHIALDFTVEYMSADCWTVPELTAKIKEVGYYIQACDRWTDDEGEFVAPGTPNAYEPDGTFEDCPKQEWVEQQTILKFCHKSRKAFRGWTEADLDFICGASNINPYA